MIGVIVNLVIGGMDILKLDGRLRPSLVFRTLTEVGPDTPQGRCSGTSSAGVSLDLKFGSQREAGLRGSGLSPA